MSDNQPKVPAKANQRLYSKSKDEYVLPGQTTYLPKDVAEQLQAKGIVEIVQPAASVQAAKSEKPKE